MDLNAILYVIVDYAILLFEYIGVGVLIKSGIVALINLFRRKPGTRLGLAKGMAMALEFKLGSEILRTVVLRNWDDLLIAAGIIVLRAALTFLIHWEITKEEANCVSKESEI
ncbi:MAG: DUF1622 domain-containing protein [Eubacteriales bacterium]